MTLQTVVREGTSTVALSGLNLLDWTIGMVVAISVVSAFMRGLIRSVLSLAGLIVSVVLAALYATTFAVYLSRWITSVAVADIVAFLAIVLFVFVAASLAGRLIRSAAEAAGLGFFDRLGGALFGAARAVLFLAAIAVPFVAFIPRFAVTRESVLLPYLLRAAHGISFVLPRDFAQRIAGGS